MTQSQSAPDAATEVSSDYARGLADGAAKSEAKLIETIYPHAIKTDSSTSFVLGQIIQSMGLSERYHDYARTVGSRLGTKP